MNNNYQHKHEQWENHCLVAKVTDDNNIVRCYKGIVRAPTLREGIDLLKACYAQVEEVQYA